MPAARLQLRRPVSAGVAAAQVHALWLNLPASTCAARAEARVDHEGGLEGAQARAVALRMHAAAAAAPPRRAEGLATIRVRSPATLPHTQRPRRTAPVRVCGRYSAGVLQKLPQGSGGPPGPSRAWWSAREAVMVTHCRAILGHSRVDGLRWGRRLGRQSHAFWCAGAEP